MIFGSEKDHNMRCCVVFEIVSLSFILCDWLCIVCVAQQYFGWRPG